MDSRGGGVTGGLGVSESVGDGEVVFVESGEVAVVGGADSVV